ncbi:MAG: ATP-binding cassette domain-containing protein [Planctomycetes bacterium]|jgi:ABC-type lipoprotein export system ATPase subunit|nr:ABC transporter ATP-binding protein [Phycisphaerae bacterium]NBB95997.1 ATP-binding cassette domain-containing protein [Planctomycetota bacterium]
MTNSDNILEASGIVKAYGRGETRTEVLRGLNLSVRAGEFLVVMGPSGCGKSTLLHILGLMGRPHAGTVTFGGKVVGDGDAERNAVRREQIGFVFQRFNLLSVLSAVDNVRISLKVRGRADVNGRVEQLMDLLGVTHVARRKPGRMSIGEQQRVAVVRALAHEPALLLADEPTGNLDSASSDALLDLLRKINRDSGQTIVMITHSVDAAGRADRILHMKDGQLREQS